MAKSSKSERARRIPSFCISSFRLRSQASASQALGCVHQHCSGAHIKLRAAHINTIQEAHQS
eukprot:90331-Pelagomonas_calceolata.AAC.3